MNSEERADIALKMSKLIIELKDNVLTLVLARQYDEAREEAVRVRREEFFFNEMFRRLKAEHDLSHKDMCALLAKHFEDTPPENRPTSWERLLDE